MCLFVIDRQAKCVYQVWSSVAMQPARRQWRAGLHTIRDEPMANKRSCAEPWNYFDGIGHKSVISGLRKLFDGVSRQFADTAVVSANGPIN